jgi:hypothetical protein
MDGVDGGGAEREAICVAGGRTVLVLSDGWGLGARGLVAGRSGGGWSSAGGVAGFSGSNTGEGEVSRDGGGGDGVLAVEAIFATAGSLVLGLSDGGGGEPAVCVAGRVLTRSLRTRGLSGIVEVGDRGGEGGVD